MGRPFHSHIDDDELKALVPSSSEESHGLHRLSTDAIREAERHVASCAYCSEKVLKYRQFVNRSSNVVVSEAAPPGASCPSAKDVDWHEVAAGLWPESKAAQLIMHAALCDHCGPLLRAATSVDDDPTPQEEALLAQLRVPACPVVEAKGEPIASRTASRPSLRSLLHWKILAPSIALLLIAGVFAMWPRSPGLISGSTFAEFAVSTHRQHARGSLSLDVHSDSQQTVNEWLKAKLPFALALPASPQAPGEERPFRVEGARLVPIVGKTAAFIAYQMQNGPVSLMVAPASVAVASGGVEVGFRKVSFHYRMVEGYRVVTWSQHGLTYALVSQEGNGTQQSCMVCHSAMRDRDLSHTPAPLRAAGSTVELFLR